jgi:hypothetical protein
MCGTDFRSRFDEHGYVRLRRGFTAEQAGDMADALWRELNRRHGIVRSDPATWTVAEPRGLGALRRRGTNRSPAPRLMVTGGLTGTAG